MTVAAVTAVDTIVGAWFGSVEAVTSTFHDCEAARPLIDRHQALMWEVGDLMNQWEALQTES